MLRTGVLEGRRIALWGAPGGGLDARLDDLGATVEVLNAASPSLAGGDAAPGGAPRRVDTLVADTRSAFVAAGGGYEGLRAGVDGAFAAARDCAVAHWIDRPGTGQVVLVAPAPGTGAHTGAARAALENVARSLGTEWARHEVTVVAVLPGDGTPEEELAELVAWVASPAGAYLSGTALTLDGPA